MIALKNNRFCGGGISFPFPNGLYLNTDVEMVSRDSIEFRPEDQSFCIQLRFLRYDEPTPEYMSRPEHSMKDFQFCTCIQEFKWNGLTGYWRKYSYPRCELFDAYFDADWEDSDVHLAVYIDTKKEYLTMDKVLALKHVKALLEGISPGDGNRPKKMVQFKIKNEKEGK